MSLRITATRATLPGLPRSLSLRFTSAKSGFQRRADTAGMYRSRRARARPPLVQRTAGHAFAKLLKEAGIGGSNDGRRAPCLHSLRHAAAVHRLESWYRQGADVQRLLPTLSIWLGHTDLNGTRIYLSMTPELLHQASVRFDAYVNGGGDHE